MRFRQIFCGLTLLFCAWVAQAQNIVTERSWVEDPTGTMTLAEVQQAPQTPFPSDVFTQGFSQSVYWIRLHIDPKAAVGLQPDESLVIRIRPPYQDQIQLFDPLAKSDRIRQTGDYFDWAKDEYQSLNLNFVIPVGDASRDVWLRLRTNQSTLTVLQVMTESEVRAADRRQELLSMLYFAVLLICMGWGVLSYINQPDRLVGLYVLREAFAISYAMVMLGYFRMFASGWIPADAIDPISNALVLIFVAVVIWFDAHLIREFQPNRWFYRVLLVLPTAVVLELLLMALGKTYLAIKINAILIFVDITWVFVTVLTTRAWREAARTPGLEKPVFSKPFLISMYGLIILAVLLNRVQAMGVGSGQEGFLYLNLVYAMLSSLSMMALVQIRAFRLRKRHEDAQHRLKLAEQEAVHERERREEQSNFLKMLAHEMKTPLSVVRMAIGRDQPSSRINDMADRAVRDMNGIIERLLDVEKLNDQRLKMQKTSFDLIELLHKILNASPAMQRMQVIAPASLMLESDTRFVQIILNNLVENAIKYGAIDAPIYIDISEGDTSVDIAVCNPVGTAGAPDSAQVFDKYYRAPGAHEHTGSGLGLYLTNALVNMLGGQIRYAEVDGMICFNLRLPGRRG